MRPRASGRLPLALLSAGLLWAGLTNVSRAAQAPADVAPEATAALEAATRVVTFSSPGTKAVTLTVGNWSGTVQATQQVTVLDPNPSVTTLTITPPNPHRCQLVSFAASAAGRPPLSYAWQVLDAVDQPVANLAGTTATSWTVPATAVPGTLFKAKLVVDNVEVPTGQRIEPFTVAPLAVSFAPIVVELAPSLWSFSLDVPEAAEWSWDFDDDVDPLTTVWSDWTTQPVSTFFYRWTGQRTIRVRIRTCFEPSPGPPVEGGLVTVVDVDSVEPLVFEDGFEAGTTTDWPGL